MEKVVLPRCQVPYNNEAEMISKFPMKNSHLNGFSTFKTFRGRGQLKLICLRESDNKTYIFYKNTYITTNVKDS